MRFYTIATCLAEITIENRALWELVRKRLPTQTWPPPELQEARKDFEDLDTDIRALITDPRNLPDLLQALTKRLTNLIRAT